MRDCKKCQVFDVCPVIKWNGGNPVNNCLGPIFLNSNNSDNLDEAIEEIKIKIRTKDYKKVKLRWEN